MILGPDTQNENVYETDDFIDYVKTIETGRHLVPDIVHNPVHFRKVHCAIVLCERDVERI